MLYRYDVSNPLLSPFGFGLSSGRPLTALMTGLLQDLENAMPNPTARRTASPRFRLEADAERMMLIADVPGHTPEGVEVSVDDGQLRLKLSAAPSRTPEGAKLIHRERPRATEGEWSWELPYPIDTAAVTAALKDGRLVVTLPKAPEARPKTIPVKSV